MTVDPGFAILLFAVGMGILVQVALAFARVQRLYSFSKHAEQDLFELFERRRNHLPRLIRAGDELRGIGSVLTPLEQAMAKQRVADTLDEQVEAEHAISRAVALLIARAEMLELTRPENGGEFAEIIAELMEMDPLLHAGRERYNEAAVAWNLYRRIFPGNVLAEATGRSEVPVFPVGAPTS